MNPGKKALMIALVKLGLYEAPTSYAFFLFSSSLIHSNSSLLPRAWDSASDEILNRSSLLILLFDPVHKKGFSHLKIERYWWLRPNFDSDNQGSLVNVYFLYATYQKNTFDKKLAALKGLFSWLSLADFKSIFEMKYCWLFVPVADNR